MKPGQVRHGRLTAAIDGDVTVFLIGLRFNKPWQVHRWLPVLVAMPRMLAHLEQHPEVGMLGQRSWVGRTTLLLSYWRSPEHLQRFASDRDAPHLEPWRAFQRRVDAEGSVGIWHETYLSRAGEHETVYVDMPPFGLGAATGSVPIGPDQRTARQRMRRGTAAAPPEET